MMREFNTKDANFLWCQMGKIDGVLKRIRDDIDKFVDNKTKDYENIQE